MHVCPLIASQRVPPMPLVWKKGSTPTLEKVSLVFASVGNPPFHPSSTFREFKHIS